MSKFRAIITIGIMLFYCTSFCALDADPLCDVVRLVEGYPSMKARMCQLVDMIKEDRLSGVSLSTHQPVDARPSPERLAEYRNTLASLGFSFVGRSGDVTYLTSCTTGDSISGIDIGFAHGAVDHRLVIEQGPELPTLGDDEIQKVQFIIVSTDWYIYAHVYDFTRGPFGIQSSSQDESDACIGCRLKERP